MRRGSRLLVSLALLAAGYVVPSQAARAPRKSLDVVMLSDLHFDPYSDPAKVGRLQLAPAAGWRAILEEPESSDRAAQFASLQAACKTRGVDSSWSVVADSLKAAHAHQTKPLFVTVSGDLLVHNFDCRMHALLPNSSADDLTHFAEKTVEFIALELHRSFPGVSVYIALGNNDSGCADYDETPGSEFLRNAAQSFSQDVLDKAGQSEVRREFSALGDYDVALPSPMGRTRLVVMQDIFQSRLYAACGGKHDAQPAKDQIDWLHARLAAARARHESVWVMAHIPTGIDVYSTFHKFVLNPQDICSVKSTTDMLGSDAMADTLTEFADVVRLVVFGHTHMDEMKLLHTEAGAAVPVKLVPSVSPVNGNTPAFTLARVDPASGTLRDYSVYAKGTESGGWALEYNYAKMYGMPDYSGASVKKLTTALAADRTGDSELSRKYQKWFYPGDAGLYGLGLRQIWPAYACSTLENGGKAFHECMCPAPPPPAPVQPEVPPAKQ